LVYIHAAKYVVDIYKNISIIHIGKYGTKPQTTSQ